MRSVAVDNLTKDYGSAVALKDVSLEVRGGEFLSILGPSGCGKSTLLRIIAGLDEPTSGRIEIAGEDVTDTPVWRRRIGFVFQNFALWPHLTTFRNLSMGLELQRLPRETIRQRVMTALDLVKLQDYSERYPSQLSGGQQQRVALARAIVLEPSVLLLDEPLSSLDKNLRQDMQVEIKALHQKTGLTTIFVTHDQDEALSLSDRIVVMDRGVVVQVDTPDAIYSQPANAYVARFVGETTFFEGRLSIEGDVARLMLDGGASIALVGATGRVDGQQVRAFARPEWIALAPDVGSRNGAGLRGEIERRMFFGATVDYLVRLENGQSVRAKTTKALSGLAEGSAVEVVIRAQLLEGVAP